MLNQSELNDLKVSESDAYLEGMKRYSEFVSLHNKLLKSSSHARLVKGNRISSCSSNSHHSSPSATYLYTTHACFPP